MMREQTGPKQLVRDVALAGETGFDFAVISDRYFPWLEAQGHSPYAWSVLGAAAQATRRIPLMTYVTADPPLSSRRIETRFPRRSRIQTSDARVVAGGQDRDRRLRRKRKSHLARQLGALLAITPVHLDGLYYASQMTRPRPPTCRAMPITVGRT